MGNETLKSKDSPHRTRETRGNAESLCETLRSLVLCGEKNLKYKFIRSLMQSRTYLLLAASVLFVFLSSHTMQNGKWVKRSQRMGTKRRKSSV
jgi:hypothetical protein